MNDIGLTRDEKVAIVREGTVAGITKVMGNVVDDLLTGTPEPQAMGILAKGMDRYFKVHDMAVRIIDATSNPGGA